MACRRRAVRRRWRLGRRLPDHAQNPDRRVARGGFPPRAPTDPYVRDYRIRLLGSWTRCPCFATWWSFVEMVVEPDVSFIVPSTSSMLRPRLPSTGPSGQFPRFSGTTRCSDSPPPIPSCFVAFAQRYRSRFLFRSRGGRNRPAGARAWSPGARPGSLRRRRGLPGSWTSPLRTCSAPGPRWNRSAPASSGLRCSLPLL